jgi:hypothetical protein
VALAFSCTGNALPRCRGDVFLSVGGDPAGHAKLSLMPARKSVVLVKLPKKVWKLLVSKKRIKLDVAVSAATGLSDTDAYGRVLTVTAPKKPAKPAAKRR